MPNRKGIVFLIIGAVLIISALLLFFYNQKENVHAGQEAETMLSDVQSVILERVNLPVSETGDPDTAPSIEPDIANQELPIALINGYEYVGYISIPSLEIELPVMATWDYDRLKLAPCRHFGSSKTDDLVIAAHNYESHFGQLKELLVGDSVIFTDMDGTVNTYSVVSVEKLIPSEVETVQKSGYDLVLYTCTKGGQARIAVFCDRNQARTLLPEN